MELREFKHWLIDNGFEENELYLESIKCYQVEAYRAAYIFSYLANHKYISEVIIKYRGVPKSFERNCPDEDVRSTNWQKKVSLLKNEDSWEEEVNNLINADINGKAGNIFALHDNIRRYFPEMRNLRNIAAHAKERRITESTVQELWNNIVYLYPNFVINGSKDDWLDEFNQLVQYSNYDSELLENKIDSFKDFSVENQLSIIKVIIKKYLIDIDWNEKTSKIVLDFLHKTVIDLKGPTEENLLFSPIEEVYLLISVDGYSSVCKGLDLFSQFEKLIKDYSFRYFCDKFPENFWKLIDSFSREIKEDKLLAIVFNFLKSNDSVLLSVDYKNHKILSENETFLNKVLEKIEHLYYYTMYHTGQKRHNTLTFDYSRIESYNAYINYIFYRVSENDLLAESNDRVKEFISRCSKLIKADYSGDTWHSEKDMQEYINQINQRYGDALRIGVETK
ncbi:TPA: hypothetical protein ACGOSV_001114 [Streptococcus suis]